MSSNRRHLVFALPLVTLLGCSNPPEPTPRPDPTFSKEDALRTDIPTSSADEHVAVYQRKIAKVANWTSADEADREEDLKRAVQDLVESLKRDAFYEAAAEINHDLAQPMDATEYRRAVDSAAKNFTDYLNDWNYIDQKVNGSEVEISAYFQIDKSALRASLVANRAIVTVAARKTYVELFWNVPNKKINPDVVMSALKNTEDSLAQKGYEVVQFDRIKGKLLKLLEDQGEAMDDPSTQDELARFSANLELRNIDSRFKNGKQILAEYADILVGITVSAIEVTSSRMLKVRLAAEVTLFERGEWVTLTNSDAGTGMLPYVAGSTDNMIATTRMAAHRLFKDLEPKMRDKLAKRKAVEEVVDGSPQDYALVFKGFKTAAFNKIRRALKNSKHWKTQKVDMGSRTVHVTFEGSKDEMADDAQAVLAKKGVDVGDPSFSSDGRKIFFVAE
jgi:hypothetical protein